MAESITNKKIISFAGKNIDLDEFIRRALARAVEWMDYQGLKGDERVDFLNSFNTRLLNIVSGQSGNSEQPSTTIAVGGDDNNGTNYYGKSTGDRKEDGKPKGGLFGTSRRTGFNPEQNVDTYLNGIAGTIPSVEEQNAATTQSTASTLKPFNPSTMGNYIGNEIFGEGNAPTEKLLQAWIDAHDKLGEDGKRSTDGRRQFINQKLLAYRQELLDGKYQISDEDRNKEIAKIDKLLSPDIQDWEIGKLAPWMNGLLANPTASTLIQNPTTLDQTTEQAVPAETVVEEATEPQMRHDLKDEMTAEDWARIGSIAGDIVSAGAAYIPTYGTIASAITGVGSTLAGAYADFNDKSVTGGEALLNTTMGLGADLIGLAPGIGTGAKYYKIGKALAKIKLPTLIKLARTYGIGDAGLQALTLTYNKAVKGEALNSDDLKTLKFITSVGSGEARVHGAKRATQRVLQSAKKVEGTTVNTSKGRKVVDNTTAEKLSKAKTKADADLILKDAAKTNPDLEGAEAVFNKTRVSMTPWKQKEVNFTNPGRKPGYTEPTGKVGRYLDINPLRGQIYDFSNVKQRSSWFGRNFSDEAIVARRVDAVNYKGRPDYKAKLNENPTTAESSTSGTKPKTTKPKGLNPKTATKAVTTVDKTGNTASLERHIKKATGVTLDKSNPNSKVNLRTAIQDLKKAGHTDEQISNMLTNKQFMEALKQQYKFKEGGLIPMYRNPFGSLITMPTWLTSLFTPESKHTTKTFTGTTSTAEPATTSLATSTVPEPKPEAPKPQQSQAKPNQPLEGTVGGNLEGIVGQTGGTSLTTLNPTVDTNPGGGKSNTPGRQIGNPTDLALTGIELGKFFGSMWANNAILNKYKQLRPYHRINPQQAYRIWSPKPLLDLAQQTKTDADNLGALMARGTSDLGQAAAYRLTSHFKGVDAARPYELQADKEIKDSVNTAISIQNDNQEKRVERVNDNHKADVAKFNQDRLAEIQRLHDNATKLQQLGTTMQNGIARGAVAKYENDYRSFLASDPEIVNARNAYRNAKARYDANPNDTKAQQELTNAQNALNNILTDKSNYWLSNHRLALGFPFGPVIWTSPIPLYQSSFFAKGGNLEVVDRVERGRMRRHYDKLFYNTHKLLVTESNKKQRAMGSGFAYFHKLMMQSK